jgi:uncharacterized protein with HEPN domain
MTKNPLVYIEHILDSIDTVEEYTKKVSKQQFLSSKQIQDSVVRRIEIIGEAVKNIPDHVREKYPAVPWKSIAGMRDKIVHEYFSIDFELAWVVAKKELPRLKKNMIIIKKELAQ